MDWFYSDDSAKLININTGGWIQVQGQYRGKSWRIIVNGNESIATFQTEDAARKAFDELAVQLNAIKFKASESG